MFRLLLVILAIILYGSLFPLRFEASGTPADALRALANGWPERIPRGDALANILLYMPLGFALAGLALRRAKNFAAALVAVFLATIAGFALSLGIETAQFFIPVRTVSLSDFIFNGAGSLLGASLALLSRFSGARGAPRIGDMMALLLALAWAADRLWPLIPVLDVSNIKDALKPFLFAFSLSPLTILRLALGWFLFGVLTVAALGRSRLVESLILLATLAAAFSPPFLLGRTLTADGLAGAMLGLALWMGWRNLKPASARLAPLIAAVMLVAIVGLAPYQFLDSARDFNFIPFTDFIGSTRAAAAQSIILKGFLFGALIWSLGHARVPLALIALAGPGLLFSISVTQMWLPGRSAAVTDAVIGLAMVFALVALRAPSAARNAAAPEKRAPRDPRRATPVLPP